QTVQGASATNSGLLLMPMMLSMMVVSLFVGQVITRTGRYKVFPVIGGVFMALGMYLLSRQDAHTTRWQTGLFIGVLGFGRGFLRGVAVRPELHPPARRGTVHKGRFGGHPARQGRRAARPGRAQAAAAGVAHRIPGVARVRHLARVLVGRPLRGRAAGTGRV